MLRARANCGRTNRAVISVGHAGMVLGHRQAKELEESVEYCLTSWQIGCVTFDLAAPAPGGTTQGGNNGKVSARGKLRR